MLFQSKKPHYEYLRKRWTAQHHSLQQNLWQKHAGPLNWLAKNIPVRQLAVGGLGGLMLLNTPSGMLLSTPHLMIKSEEIVGRTDKNVQLAAKLSSILPPEVGVLTAIQEQETGKVLSDSFGFKVSAELDGVRLNRSYGLIGGEQHLYRYPGDNVAQHADNLVDWAMYGPAGIAPGLGAWGYFAPSKEAFTPQDSMRERYYIAVQTFLSPGFAENVGKYRDFFKYRKMLLVNPKTGQTVIADIADAGPADWTGKQLGGSPEVMQAVGLAEGPRKGAVLYFFIDDPNDKIPLGPIKAKD